MQKVNWCSLYQLRRTLLSLLHKRWCFYDMAVILQLPESAKDLDWKTFSVVKILEKTVVHQVSTRIWLIVIWRGASKGLYITLMNHCTKMCYKCPHIRFYEPFNVISGHTHSNGMQLWKLRRKYNHPSTLSQLQATGYSAMKGERTKSACNT